ncbi:RNHCP domain-containing protein [Streptomyces sp. NPDC000594]|uniref:RNHCP domain-containing protein n=1 Tax=Streptomyces sp. NPDC000594 TaxID=3154261 RepID=UPI0033258455
MPHHPDPATSRPTPPPVPFDCVRCGATTAPEPGGAPRDHCPRCLHSRHLTTPPNGGPTACGAPMSPISIAVAHAGELTVIHRCDDCSALTSAPVRPDDNHLVVMRVAVRPLAAPPFPLEALAGF